MSISSIGLIGLLSIVGCKDDGTGTDDSGVIDADGDGYAEDEDCNDNDATINPGADEVCDSLDNDCNDLVDDDPVDGVSGWTDADGDGYGAGDALVACDISGDLVDNDEDCDDTDATVNPDSIWWGDADSDGYGTPYDYVQACEAPSGYVVAPNDCNDADPAVSPDADEVCDFVDNDCNGIADDDYATDAPTWYGDVDADEYGDASSTTVACYEPEGFIADNTDCDDADEGVNPGAEEICNDGVDNDCSASLDFCSLSLDDADTVLTGEAEGDQAGVSVIGAGDLNSDGFADVVIGAEAEASIDTDAGAAYIFYGPLPSGEVSLGDAAAKLTGGAYNYRAGLTLTGGDDVDGDGVDDVAIAALRANGSGTTRGQIYIYSGGTALSGDYDLESTADYVIEGEGNTDRLGSEVTFSDLTGDSTADVIVGSLYEDTNNKDAGAVYVFNGPLSGDIVATDADTVVYGEDASGNVGGDAIGADLDGDGAGDLIIGYSQADGSTGAIYAFTGGVAGSANVSDADVIWTGISGSDLAGASIANIGDWDGDGKEDVIIGAPGNSDEFRQTGAAYIVLGGTASGDLSVAAVTFYGSNRDDAVGSGVAGGGDFNGDGALDVVVSTPYWGPTDVGASYLIYADSSMSGDYYLDDEAAARLEGGAAEDGAGTTAFVGDTNGAGVDHLMVGAGDADPVGSGSGAAYLILALSE